MRDWRRSRDDLATRGDAQAGGDFVGRIFSRVAGTGGAFVEELSPSPVGVNVMSMQLRCFGSGRLWALATLQMGDDVSHQQGALFYRPNTGAAWQSLPVPAGVGNAGLGLQGAVIDSDGVGVYVFTRSPLEGVVFSRDAQGMWEERFSFGPYQVLSFVGDPVGEIRSVIDSSVPYVGQRASGAWSLVDVSSSWSAVNGVAAASGPTFVLLGDVGDGAVSFKRDTGAIVGSSVTGRSLRAALPRQMIGWGLFVAQTNEGEQAFELNVRLLPSGG